MQTRKLILLRTGVSVAVLLLGTIAALLIHSHTRIDFSGLDAKSRPFYQAVAKCQLVATAKLDLWAGHDVQMNRYQCDSAAMQNFPPGVLQDDEGLQNSSSIEVMLFIQQTWLSRRALIGDYSDFKYKQVVYSSIDGHPAVLLETAGEGSGGYSSWKLVTAMPNGGIGAAEHPPSDEDQTHLKGHLGPTESVGSDSPSIRGTQLLLTSEIYEASDGHCCPTGGALQSHYSLDQGSLKITSTRRLSEAQAKRIAKESLPPLVPGNTTVASVPSLTHVGTFTDPPIGIDIGVTCPDSAMPNVSNVLHLPASKSCDSVFIFRELSGSKMRLFLFLYRGRRPPATFRELCQVRYSGELFSPPSGTDMDTNYILKTAPKLPEMKSVEEVSAAERNEFVGSIDPTQWRMMQAQGIVFFNKGRAAKRYWH
jgi:hypothetical protein